MTKGLLVIEAGMPDFDERLKLLRKATGMTTHPVIEAMARAIFQEQTPSGFPWDMQRSHIKEDHRDIARAALAAALESMKEPSEGMLNALNDVIGGSDEHLTACIQIIVERFEKEALGDDET